MASCLSWVEGYRASAESAGCGAEIEALFACEKELPCAELLEDLKGDGSHCSSAEDAMDQCTDKGS